MVFVGLADGFDHLTPDGIAEIGEAVERTEGAQRGAESALDGAGGVRGVASPRLSRAARPGTDALPIPSAIGGGTGQPQRGMPQM